MKARLFHHKAVRAERQPPHPGGPATATIVGCMPKTALAPTASRCFRHLFHSRSVRSADLPTIRSNVVQRADEGHGLA